MDKEPKTHYYTCPRWGHDYVIHAVEDNGNTIHASGWGYGLQEGDYMIFPNKEGTTRYRIKQIKYKSDPSDMFFATLTFAPRPASGD